MQCASQVLVTSPFAGYGQAPFTASPGYTRQVPINFSESGLLLNSNWDSPNIRNDHQTNALRSIQRGLWVALEEETERCRTLEFEVGGPAVLRATITRSSPTPGA